MRRIPSVPTLCLLLAAALLTGCLGGPRLEPDTVGFDELLVPPAPETPPYPSAAELPQLGDSNRPEYRVGPLDEIVILVWGRPDLGSQLPAEGGRRVSVVGSDGTIGLAFLGRLTVGGKTLSEIRAMLDSRYAEVVESPQVDVELAACHSQFVSVEGEVPSPGRRSLCIQRNTLGEVLTAEGGWNDRSDPSRIVLDRKGKLYSVNYTPGDVSPDAVRNVLLEDGDRLYVPVTGCSHGLRVR